MKALLRLTTIALLLNGCIPTTASYLRIPVEPTDGRDRITATVEVPFAELSQRMTDFDAATVAFYGEGRTPLAHRLVDRDGDGRADAALVSLPVAGDGQTRLIALCPGPKADGVPPSDTPDAGVTLNFEQARQ